MIAIRFGFKILVTKLQDGSWMPVLATSPECPTPIFVVVNTLGMAGLSEDEWIAQYKKLNEATINEFNLVDFVLQNSN